MKLLIQDDILDGMDVYVEYTSEAPLGRIPDPADIVLLDYGLELDGETRINGLMVERSSSTALTPACADY
jgi:hypothetical protein